MTKELEPQKLLSQIVSLQDQLEKLEQEKNKLEQEKNDLSILLDMTTTHSNIVENELQNQADETKRRSEKKLAQFLDAMPVGVSVLEANGKAYYLNKMAQQLLGKEITADLEAEDFTQIYQFHQAGTNQSYPSQRLPAIRALQGESTTVDDIEIHNQGKIIPLEVWGTPVFDETNQVNYAIVAFRDITERKLAEAEHIRYIREREALKVAQQLNQEIENKNQELVKLNQEKSEFLQIAAHDLKNPLSVIRGLAEDMMEYYELTSKDEVIDSISMIHNSAQQMFNLITNLLDVNVIETGRMKLSLDKVDILFILKKLIKSHQERAKAKKIILNFTIAKNNTYIAFADAGLARQILDNLISNAIKYSPHGKNVFIRLLHTSHIIRCEIQDEGPGLSEADQKQLFGKFTRLTAQPTGKEHSTGLGLFIVKKLVQILNGKVWCETQLGKGATFIVELPVI